MQNSGSGAAGHYPDAERPSLRGVPSGAEPADGPDADRVPLRMRFGLRLSREASEGIVRDGWPTFFGTVVPTVRAPTVLADAVKGAMGNLARRLGRSLCQHPEVIIQGAAAAAIGLDERFAFGVGALKAAAVGELVGQGIYKEVCG